MSRKLLYPLFFFCMNFSFAQQNEEFKGVKDYFDYQRFMLNSQFKKRFDTEKNNSEKLTIKKDFVVFMRKMDSIQNTAYIGSLIKVKNREDLRRINLKDSSELHVENPKKRELNEEAKYPGGIENLREQVANLFYSEAVLANEELLKTQVTFMVEKDGSISCVHAEGDSFTFNRQAEIAMYLLPEKFSPALMNGTAVRYRFQLPLSMNFE